MSSKPKQSLTPQNKEAQIKAAVQDPEIDPFDAAIVAQLMQGGMSKEEAKAQVFGNVPAAQPQNENPLVDPEPEPKVIPQKSKDFSDDQVKLYEMLQNIDDANSYDVEVEIPAYLMRWVIRKTLQEAHTRNDPGFLVEDFLILLLKEQRAIDPTKGGEVTGGSSGPKETYNPISGKWG